MGGHRWHDATRNFTPSSFYLQCQERGEGRRPKQTDGQMLGMEEVEDQYRNQISCWHKELFSRLLMSC